MSELINAAETFFEQLAAVGWAALGIALGLHLARVVTRVFAWRTILAAAFPDTRVPWWSVCGSYIAGIGVNAILPARGGDLLRLFLVKRRVEGSTYPTLGATLLLETAFDTVVAGAVLAWAATLGVFPSLDVLPDLPTIDWHWPLEHPTAATAIGLVWLAVVVVLAWIGTRRVREFRRRVAQGFAVLREPARFVRGVIAWQAGSWILRATSVYFFLEAFGVPATLRNTMLVLAVQSLSTVFPFTPGGVGTQQGLLVFVFDRASAIAKTTLLSFSIGMYIAVTVVNVAAGFAAIFLMLRTLRWRRFVAGEEREVESPGASR